MRGTVIPSFVLTRKSHATRGTKTRASRLNSRHSERIEMPVSVSMGWSIEASSGQSLRTGGECCDDCEQDGNRRQTIVQPRAQGFELMHEGRMLSHEIGSAMSLDSPRLTDARAHQTRELARSNSASYHRLVGAKCSSPSSARKIGSCSLSLSARSYASAASSLRVAKSNMVKPPSLTTQRI
jgi:hypothetical protein